MQNIKELESKLNETTNVLEQIDLINEIVESLRNSDLQSSIQYSKQAVELAEKNSCEKEAAKSYWNYGINLRLSSQFDEALSYFNKSLKIYEKLDDFTGQATILNSTANIFANQGNYRKALEYLSNSLWLLERKENKDSGSKFFKVVEASILSNFGSVYQEMGDYSSALEYYLKSAQVHTEHLQGIPETLLNNIGEVYKMLGEYDTALEYYLKSLKLAREHHNISDEGFALLSISVVYGTLKNFDKAFIYLSESLEILRKLGYNISMPSIVNDPDLSEAEKAIEFHFSVLSLRNEISDKSGAAETLSNIGLLYFNNAKNNLAEKYFLDSLKLADELHDKLNQTKNYLLLGKLYLNNKEYEKGFEYLNKALLISEERNAKKDISEIHKAYYEGYKRTGDFAKAMVHHEKFYSFEKEILNIESDKKLGGLALKYETEKSENEKKIALQEKEIFRLKNVELAKMNKNLKYINDEKNDFIGIAAHDLKNPLSGILSLSRKIKNSGEVLSRVEINGYAGEIEKASQKMFEMITKMLNVTAIESGKRNIQAESFDVSVLAQRVVLDYRQKAELKRINVKFEAPEKMQVHLDKMALREILDNVYSNAVKFSPFDKNIYFKVTADENIVRFSIKDEGPGLTEKDKIKLFGKFTRLSAQPTGGENSTGLGLSIAKKLTEAMNGKIWCESKEGGGAEFIIELPVFPKESFG